MSLPIAEWRSVRMSALHLFSVWNLAILLVVLILVFSLLKGDTFLTAFTFQSMVNSRSINALVALAVMIPIAANNFDLSVASILGISQVLANGLQTQQGLSWQAACLLCIIMGAIVGLINGFLVTRARINSFIATLGSGTLLLGLNQWYTGGRQVVGVLPRDFVAIAGKIPFTGVPLAVVYVLVVVILLWVVFDYLPLGRFLYIIGDSPRAAELNIADTLCDDRFRRLGSPRRARRRHSAGPAPGWAEHCRAGADAARLHRSPAGRDSDPAWSPQRLGHPARGRRTRCRRCGPHSTRRAVLCRESIQWRDARARGRPRGPVAAKSRPKEAGRGRRGEAGTMNAAFDLTGRRILITGAADGIGAATARVCASLGAEILLVDLRNAASVADQIREAGGRASCRVADVGARATIERLAAAVGDVDGLVANAAVCPWDDDWDDLNWDANFDRVMAVNVLGPIHLARVFLPGMIRRRWGRIVFVGSLAGRTGGLIAGPHYVASKGGIHALVKWLARRAGPHNVLVNGVAPASVETPMMTDRPVDLARIPLARKAQPEEVAWPIAFLCSGAASYICGAVLDVNGGVHMG